MTKGAKAKQMYKDTSEIKNYRGIKIYRRINNVLTCHLPVTCRINALTSFMNNNLEHFLFKYLYIIIHIK